MRVLKCHIFASNAKLLKNVEILQHKTENQISALSCPDQNVEIEHFNIQGMISVKIKDISVTGRGGL
jgi:hypothetical protein